MSRLRVPVGFLSLLVASALFGQPPPSADAALPGIDPLAIVKLSSVNYFALAPALLGLKLTPSRPPSGRRPDSIRSFTEENVTSSGDHEAESAVIAMYSGGVTHTVTAAVRYIGQVASIVGSHKVNGGAWTTSSLPVPEAYSRYGDPLLDANFQTVGVAPGRLYCSGLLLNPAGPGSPNGGPWAIALWHSDDAGQTWQAPTIVATRSAGSVALDKPAVAVAPGGASNGYVYVAFVEADTSNSANTNIYVAGSVDVGLTFGDPVLVATGNIGGPQLVSEPTQGGLYLL